MEYVIGETSAHDVSVVLTLVRAADNISYTESFPLNREVEGFQDLRTAFLVSKRIYCACVPEKYHMLRLQGLRQRAGAAVTDHVPPKVKFGHGRVSLVTCLATATQSSHKKSAPRHRADCTEKNCVTTCLVKQVSRMNRIYASVQTRACCTM